MTAWECAVKTEIEWGAWVTGLHWWCYSVVEDRNTLKKSIKEVDVEVHAEKTLYYVCLITRLQDTLTTWR